ncbi:hypothetical protein OESDEN_19142 [Oesophagostomum dentatum]|uniref:Uncharacterized protein n=1 Tax=Oesophagostomum dentatum TaxID=61180 RepID=A0A0B1SCD7_OESDE|nr:hypothetical protein OESDEN_19142 [Oesophagostomum dentatum]
MTTEELFSTWTKSSSSISDWSFSRCATTFLRYMTLSLRTSRKSRNHGTAIWIYYTRPDSTGYLSFYFATLSFYV